VVTLFNGNEAGLVMSDRQELRPDDEDGMSPAEWLADIEVAVTEPPRHDTGASRAPGSIEADEPVRAAGDRTARGES
jgi:hypothetical protein